MSNETIDPYEYCQIVLNSDGTLTRNFTEERIELSGPPVLWKDLTINKTKNTWVRLFVPEKVIMNRNNNHKVPLIIYYHGGGFIFLSPAFKPFHNICAKIADSVGAVVVSVKYRLAPEDKLPAAYDDALEALLWLSKSQDEWLTRFADYSNCYLMGHSAGATIAYHAGLRATEVVDQLEPLKIQGLILRQAFFGGVERSESELRLQNNPIIPLCVMEMKWELALPTWANRDHECCNLRTASTSAKLEKIKNLGWKVLVSGNGEDPNVDRDKELADLMEENGIEVVKDFQEKGYHGIEAYEPEIEKKLNELVKSFINSNHI